MFKWYTVALAASLAPVASAANSQWFSGTQTIGPATATYLILTDGATGPLTTSDIIANSVTLTDGTTTDTGSLLILGDGQGLSSDGAHLYFDFDNGTGFAFDEFLSGDYLCFAGNDPCWDSTTQAVGINLSGNVSTPTYYKFDNGTQLIATLVTPSVPEPATWTMMLLGFGALGFHLRRNGRQEASIRRPHYI